jgi:O-antigen/teichoic acid export membrane protein
MKRGAGRADGEFDPTDLSHSTSKTLIMRAFSLQFIFRVLGILANIVTVTVTTRYLGPASFGALTTAILFVGLWASLTELGIGQVVVRQVMAGHGSLERLVRVNAGMSVTYSVPLFVVAAATGVAIYRNQSGVANLILIISTSLILSTISSCFQPVFVATLRFAAVAVSDLVSRLFSLALSIILVHQHAGLPWFAVVQLVPPLVVLITQGGAASRIVNCRPIFSLRESWQLLRLSFTQTVMLIIGVLFLRIDGVILSLLSTQQEVGVYGLVYTLAFTISVLPSFFATSTLSAMTHLYATDKERFARFISRSIELMVFFGAPIAIVGAFFSPDVIRVIGSSEFVARGGPTLALLLVAAAITFLNDVLSQALFAAHDQLFLMRLNIVNLLFNIVLNLILAPLYGAVGAAVALVITVSTGMLVANWRLRSLTSYKTPWMFVLKLLIPLAAAVLVSLLMRDLIVFFVVPIAAIVYIFANLIAGPVRLGMLKTLVSDTTGDSGPVSGGDDDAPLHQ